MTTQPSPANALFDETLLDDPDALESADTSLRAQAEAGARVRREAAASSTALSGIHRLGRPRALLAAGADARLLRAVLEPWCPVPFVAWPAPGLPGWAGPNDLVLVLAPDGTDEDAVSTVAEALRRGAPLLVAAPEGSAVADGLGGRETVLLPSVTGDVLAAAVVVLQSLCELGLGPEVETETVASAFDEVAVRCSPARDLTVNPAKELALVLADSLPLLWGGTVLAARAARRVVEAIRTVTGRPGLAADAGHLLPVLEAAPPADLFADPFADGAGGLGRRPALVVLDDGSQAPAVRAHRARLLATAERHAVRSHVLACADGPEMARYAALLAEGTYAATYLALGLGRFAGSADRSASGSGSADRSGSGSGSAGRSA